MHPLKEKIFEKGLSVTEFAQKTGLTESTLYYIFRNSRNNLQAATYWCISQVLEIPIREVEKLINDGRRN